MGKITNMTFLLKTFVYPLKASENISTIFLLERRMLRSVSYQLLIFNPLTEF